MCGCESADEMYLFEYGAMAHVDVRAIDRTHPGMRVKRAAVRSEIPTYVH